MPADAEAAGQCRLPNASVVTTGHVKSTCLSQLAWSGSMPYAPHTRSWKSAHTLTCLICANTGRQECPRSQGDRLRCGHVDLCQGYRQIGWLPITY
eukprot:4836612-Amphidinium_carterae.1